MRTVNILPFVVAVTALGACSPGAGKGGGIGNDGQGGGGTDGIGGTSTVLGGTGGTAGVLTVGGMGAAAGSGGMKTCQETTVNTEPVVPTVAIVVDNSSTMYEPSNDPPWGKLYEALMNPTTGAIKPLESKMRLGFYSYRSPKNHSVPETDATCADMTSVPFALDNFDEVDVVYKQVGLDGRKPAGCGTMTGQNCGEAQWDTPTPYALNKVVADLIAYNPDPPGKKNILFVTDGTPNTCLVGDPNCGQDLSIKAFQDGFAAGIGGFIIGVGDVVGDPSCDRAAMHCGADHLQDMANAGAGQPVAAQPMSYWYLQCATLASGTNPGTPQAAYAGAGQTPGTAQFFTATSSAELLSALTELLSNFVSCTFDMDGIVTGNAANSLVTLQGMPLTFGDTAAGWVLEDNKFQVTLMGEACENYKAASATEGGAEVRIVFYCDPETGRPEIEPR